MGLWVLGSITCPGLAGERRGFISSPVLFHGIGSSAAWGGLVWGRVWFGTAAPCHPSHLRVLQVHAEWHAAACVSFAACRRQGQRSAGRDHGSILHAPDGRVQGSSVRVRRCLCLRLVVLLGQMRAVPSCWVSHWLLRGGAVCGVGELCRKECCRKGCGTIAQHDCGTSQSLCRELCVKGTPTGCCSQQYLN